jgi:2-polyprenyl-3-methyl-5-hydroxy-6-metoxy-1,4-benzoquinol methylase
MKISRGLEENGIVVGNTYDKYGSKNPLVRKIMHGFSESLKAMVTRVSPQTVHEVGCGEGFWVMDWNRDGIKARGSDFSSKVIDIARTNAAKRGLPEDLFAVRSIYDLDAVMDSADLLVCCEVLEHLEKPKAALMALNKAATRYVLLSVPREPVWCFLNLIRGKYIKRIGNTPGHLQHWSSRQFVEFVSGIFDVIEVKRPIPWTMLLCRKRQ